VASCGNADADSDAGTVVSSSGVVVLVVMIVVATAFGLWRRRTDGRLRNVAADSADADADARLVSGFTPSELGVELGDRATLVQFSSAFCQPCRATRRVLLEVSEMVDGVVAVEIDAEAHLDLVRRWDVMRTPTVFVLDSEGRVARRAAGQPRKVDIIAAIGALDSVGDTDPVRDTDRPVHET
jgi:thiol-disulfide isomerase/thioredoxin